MREGFAIIKVVGKDGERLVRQKIRQLFKAGSPGEANAVVVQHTPVAEDGVDLQAPVASSGCLP